MIPLIILCTSATLLGAAIVYSLVRLTKILRNLWEDESDE